MLTPTVLRPQWQTIINPTLNANSATWDGFGLIMSYSTALLTKTGARVRLTFSPPTSGANLVISSCYIGMANTSPSFDGNQVQVTVNGSGGFTLTAGGADVVSDPINFRLTASGTLLVAFGITSGDVRRNTALATDYVFWSKAADAANAGTTTKSGYASAASRNDIVSKIEVLN